MFLSVIYLVVVENFESFLFFLPHKLTFSFHRFTLRWNRYFVTIAISIFSSNIGGFWLIDSPHLSQPIRSFQNIEKRITISLGKNTIFQKALSFRIAKTTPRTDIYLHFLKTVNCLLLLLSIDIWFCTVSNWIILLDIQ